MSTLEDDEDLNAYGGKEQEDNRAMPSASKVACVDDAKHMKTYSRLVIPSPKKNRQTKLILHYTDYYLLHKS